MERESARARLLERLQRGPPLNKSNHDEEKERRRLRQPLYVALAFDLIDDFFICISETNALKNQSRREHTCEEVRPFFHNFRLHVVRCLKHLVKLSAPPLTLVNQQQTMKQGSKGEEDETAGVLRQLLAALGGARRKFLQTTTLRTVVKNGLYDDEIHGVEEEGTRRVITDDSTVDLHTLEARIATQQRTIAAIRYSAVGEPSPLVPTTTTRNTTAVRKGAANLASCQKTAATATVEENTTVTAPSSSPSLRSGGQVNNSNSSRLCSPSHNAVLLGALGLLHRPLNADFFLETLCGIYEEEQQGDEKEKEGKEQQPINGSTNPRNSTSAEKKQQRQRRNTKACYVQEAMQLVAPRLFLGSFRPAKDDALLERAHIHGICAVVNHPNPHSSHELHHNTRDDGGLCEKGAKTTAASGATSTTTTTEAVVSRRASTCKTTVEQNGPNCTTTGTGFKIIRHSIAAEDNADFSLLSFFDGAFDFIDQFVVGVGGGCSSESGGGVDDDGEVESNTGTWKKKMLDGSTDKHGSVLVHCGAGISRSATIVAMYLLRRLNGFNTASMSSSTTATCMSSARHDEAGGGGVSSYTGTARPASEAASVAVSSVSAVETLQLDEEMPCSHAHEEVNNSNTTTSGSNLEGDIDRRQHQHTGHHNRNNTLVTVSEILSLMKYVRPMVNPNAGFRNQLQRWCTTLCQSNPNPSLGLQGRK